MDADETGGRELCGMTQKERQERSREEIYQAALEEFGTSGYDNVNMERICGNHGISKGMMYHYYSSKDALFLLCVERTFAELKDYVEHTEAVIEEYNKEHHIDNSILVNGRRQTNLGVFRAYLTAYLKSLPDVNQELVCMVRQLQPTDHGIPMELYFFCAIKDWVPYEGVQADVFDHVLAIIPEFDLQVFQSPSGRDFQRAFA